MMRYEDSIVRLGCGALVGLFLGVAIVVGTLSFWANTTAAFVVVVALSIVIGAWLGWRYGNRFFHSMSTWMGWFR
jgi:TRAP-type C4-dicarboxylate transport system permease large subunit